MDWIESHAALGSHPKLYVLADRLGVGEVVCVGHLHYLWWWVSQNTPSGELQVPARALARAAHWDGDPELFTRALVDAGFLDQTDGGWAVHDWMDYAGRRLATAKANAERQRRWRLRRLTGTGRMEAGEPAPVPNEPNFPRDVTAAPPSALAAVMDSVPNEPNSPRDVTAFANSRVNCWPCRGKMMAIQLLGAGARSESGDCEVLDEPARITDPKLAKIVLRLAALQPERIIVLLGG